MHLMDIYAVGVNGSYSLIVSADGISLWSDEEGGDVPL